LRRRLRATRGSRNSGKITCITTNGQYADTRSTWTCCKSRIRGRRDTSAECHRILSDQGCIFETDKQNRQRFYVNADSITDVYWKHRNLPERTHAARDCVSQVSVDEDPNCCFPTAWDVDARGRGKSIRRIFAMPRQSVTLDKAINASTTNIRPSYDHVPVAQLPAYNQRTRTRAKMTRISISLEPRARKPEQSSKGSFLGAEARGLVWRPVPCARDSGGIY